MNKLLESQILQYLGDKHKLSPSLNSFLTAVSAVYSDFEIKNAEIQHELKIKNQLLDHIENGLNKIHKQPDQRPVQAQSYWSEILNTSINPLPTIESYQSKIAKSIDSVLKEFQFIIAQHHLQTSSLKELEKINKELDQFAYIVSHDLKAPLRAISNLAQWIEDDIRENLKDEAKENFALLRSRVYRMENLINAILTYSKSTKLKNKTEISDTGWLLKEVIDSLDIPSHINITVQNKFPVIVTESVKLQQVFSNLISNSIKYNDKKTGEIEVGFFETEEFCQFYVKDNGPGIEKQFHKKVFQIFQTLEAKDDNESTGIGLAIVKKIIEEKGGKIWIESEKGKGAKFVFIWPKVKTVVFQNI